MVEDDLPALLVSFCFPLICFIDHVNRGHLSRKAKKCGEQNSGLTKKSSEVQV